MWEHEAAYAYFAHGPLKRMELGQDSVQGTDYAYTINGWLKGINMPSLSPDHDPGGDGAATGPNTGFARDAFGMILGYHEKDFVKSGSVYDSSHSTTSSWHVPNPTFLYNGNISSWSSNSRRASGATDTALASVYHYDLLNRIRSDSTRLRGATAWSAVGSHWQSDYTYDGNGNIKTLYRANASGSQMDALTYEYISGTNKLVNINDYQGASTGADIGDQNGNNYAYDATGNMTQDTAAGIEAGGIVWSPYNKIKSITKMGDDTTSKLVYLYDATGNRILKRYYKPYNTLKSTTWYVRDAQGNTLATYTKPSDSTTARQKEVMLYGSTRLAVAETHAPYSDSETDTLGIFDRVSSRTLGEKRYELTDHLGNVRATVSDVVIDHSGNLDAEISTRTDYYPFGMIMGGRNSSLDDAHRYGFNGKENDNEVKGEGVQQDYGFRIYDARVARFLSVDPLTKNYPSWSPYPFAMNRVIDGIDVDGLEFYAVNRESQEKVMQYIAHQFGSTTEFSWSANGKLLHESAVQLPEAFSLRSALYEEFLQIVNGGMLVGYAGDARPDETYFGVIQLDESDQQYTFDFDLGYREGVTFTGRDDRWAIVLQSPMLSDQGQFRLIGGSQSPPCASCVFIHELLDHVIPYRDLGGQDQPGQTTADLVKRHSDALNNVGIEGRRSGTEHDNAPNLPPPGTTPTPRPDGDGGGSGGNQGGGTGGGGGQPNGGGTNGTPEPRPD